METVWEVRTNGQGRGERGQLICDELSDTCKLFVLIYSLLCMNRGNYLWLCFRHAHTGFVDHYVTDCAICRPDKDEGSVYNGFEI